MQLPPLIPSAPPTGGHHHCRPLIGGHGYGYMTGAPILPIALRYVHDIAAKTNKDLIAWAA